MKNHLITAQTEWSSVDFFKKEATAEEWDRMIQLGCDLPRDMTGREHTYQVNFVGSMSEMVTLQEAFPKIKWTIGKVRGILYDADFDVTRFSGGKIDQWDGSAAQINNISVAGQALLDIRTITWVEDSCTELVQRALDDGWKIVAVCPANDSRRPTYILGHNELNKSL
jgi:hypothetical protein